MFYHKSCLYRVNDVIIVKTMGLAGVSPVMRLQRGFIVLFRVRICIHRGVDKEEVGASLVAQRLRVCLPMQGTRVRALVREDPTCRGAAGPVSHNY